MGLYNNALFTILWAGLGFFALRAIGSRFFPGTGRAEVAAVAVVIAFTAGAYWPYSERATISASDQAAAPAPPAGPAQGSAPEAAPMQERSALCARAKASHGGGVGSLDALNVEGSTSQTAASAVVASRSQRMSVLGWAAAPGGKQPALGACLIVDGSVDAGASVRYGGPRPDVAAALHSEAVLHSAYEIDVPPGNIPAGRHALTVGSLSAGGVLLPVTGTRTIVLR